MIFWGLLVGAIAGTSFRAFSPQWFVTILILNMLPPLFWEFVLKQ